MLADLFRNDELREEVADLRAKNVRLRAQVENKRRFNRNAKARNAILLQQSAIRDEMKERGGSEDPDLRRQVEALDRELADLHDPGIRPREHDYFLLSDVPEGAPTFADTDIPVQYMLDYLEHVRSIYGFLQDFPEVNISEAIGAMRDHVREEILIHVHSDPAQDNGMPVFWGSETSMRDLFEQIADGVTVDRYLDRKSAPSREQVVGTLQLACLLAEAMAYENADARALPVR